MKKLIILLSILIFGLIFFGIYYFQEESYEVIKVVEGDLIYIDLNKDKIPDDNELFHLQGINSFPLKYNHKTKIYMEKFNLSLKEVFELGYFGKEFMEKLLLNKRVKFLEKPNEYNPNYKYRFGKISLNNIDVAKILLQEGYASAYWGHEGISYVDFENKEKIRENLKYTKDFNLKILDTKNNKYYDLDEKSAYFVENPIFTPEKDIDKTKFKPNKEEQLLKEDNVKEHIKAQNLDIYLINPNKYNKPQNKCTNEACKSLLSNIKSSKKSIDLAIYGIEKQDEILNELENAKKRGVKIRCVSETNSKGEPYYHDLEKLKNICEVKCDNKNNLMHNKFFIFDDKKVLTGSANISSTGIGGYNANSIIVIENEDVAGAFKKEFEQMQNGFFQKDKTINNSKQNIKINKDTYLDIYFSPNGDIYKNVFHPLISNAKKKIYIDVFYLTHFEITKDLIEAHKRGVEILIIIDATSAKNKKSKLNELRNAGLKVKVENWGGKAHEKTMSVDGETLVLGSANFTFSAINYNDENLVVVHNSEITKEYNKFYLSIYNSINDIYLTKIPRAEGPESKNSCNDGIDNDFDGKIDKEDDGCQNIK